MTSRRQVRVNEILKREIAAGLYHAAGGKGLDLSRITVTGVEVTSDLRQALVHVSLLADEDVQQEWLHGLRRCRGELQDRLSRNVKLKYTPHLRFVLDPSMAEADRVLRVMSELEQEEQAEHAGGKDDVDEPTT